MFIDNPWHILQKNKAGSTICFSVSSFFRAGTHQIYSPLEIHALFPKPGLSPGCPHDILYVSWVGRRATLFLEWG